MADGVYCVAHQADDVGFGVRNYAACEPADFGVADGLRHCFDCVAGGCEDALFNPAARKELEQIVVGLLDSERFELRRKNLSVRLTFIHHVGVEVENVLFYFVGIQCDESLDFVD